MIYFSDFDAAGVSCAPAGSAASDDPYYLNNSLLVHFSGSNGSTSFTDESRHAFTLTAQGNAQIQGNKLDLDGSGDGVSCSGGVLHLPSSRFSFRIYGLEFDTIASAQTLLSQWEASGNFRLWRLFHNGSSIKFDITTDGNSGTITTIIDHAWAPTLGQSYDLDLTWDGTTVRLYIDGLFVSSGSLAVGTIFRGSIAGLWIGAHTSAGSPTSSLNGRIAAVQLTRGVARTAHVSGCYTRPILPFPAVQATTTDPDWDKVVLLVSGGADGTTIRDESPYDWYLTQNGGIAVSNSVHPFGSVNSIIFDGTDDWLRVASHSTLKFGSGEFTIEMMVRHSSVAAGTNLDKTYAAAWKNSSNDREWLFWFNSNASPDIINFRTSSNGSTTTASVTTASITPTLNQWYHMAATRDNSDFRVFIDGTQSGSTVTNSHTIDTTGASGIVVGGHPDESPTNLMNGYMSEIRITKGTARYNSNFTAPSAAFPRG